MVLLFLLALLLAWPTMGLSLVAYVGLIMFNGYMKANARMHYADTRQAEREVQSGAQRVPSWAGNRREAEVFVETIQEFALRKGVPKTFLLAVITNKPTWESLVHLAGAMEGRGSTFVQQQLAVSDKILEMWSDAPASVKADALRG